MSVKRADWVKTKKDPDSRMVGCVVRVARDGSWADVKWQSGGETWSKRMQTEHLRVLHTIPLGSGAVTDINRKKELEAERKQTKPWHCARCGKRMQFFDGLCWGCFGGDPGW